ncbi:MAG: cytochrome c biogenesis protein ResB, partial [Clostridia bacterium]|nr:cytochrome c biogenesis protein ResB [Clostridia bacterium]
HAAMSAAPGVTAEAIAAPEAVFRRLRMPKPVETTGKDGRPALFASKNRAGLWGAWVCHLGVLLLIAGFALGQLTQKQYTAYGVPGQNRPVGDTGYVLAIDDFRVGLRADDTVEQYTADITVYNTAGEGEASRSATISVNNPASLYGMKFYQNSTGWAATVSVTEGGEPLQEEVLCAGEYLRVADKPDLVIDFNAFYPDYVAVPGSRPMTASGQLNNPAYLYSVYYQDQMIGMNVLMADEVLTIDDYAVTFSQPQPYTLIQIKEDHFTGLALAGGLVTLLGLLLAFYVQPVTLWAEQGADGLWTLRGVSRKGGALFREQFLRAAGAADPNNSSENEGKDNAAN